MNLDTNALIPQPYTITDFYRETPDTFTITINMAVTHDPGQFVQVSIPGIGESPISIASASDTFMKLSIRQVGNVTNALSLLKKGDQVLVRGPYGRGYPMRELVGNNLLIIGGGCGVAPLKGIIDYVERYRDAYNDVRLIVGYRSPDDILFSRELNDWQQKYRLDVTVDKNPEEKFCYDGKQGFVTDVLQEKPAHPENAVAFVCGPPMMMDSVIALLNAQGWKDTQIFISAERLMYCAVGACCHCMMRSKFTCVDGPVFRYDEVKEFTND